MASSTNFIVDSDDHIELHLEYKFDVKNLKTIDLTFNERDQDGDVLRKGKGQISVKEIKALRNYLNSFLEVCGAGDDFDNMM